MFKALRLACFLGVFLLVTTLGHLSVVYAYDQEKPENRTQLLNNDNEYSYVRIHTFGTAIGMYYDARMGGGWRTRQGVFEQGGSGFVVKNGYILTAAHVVIPEMARVVSGKYSTDVRALYKVLKQIILVYHFSDTPFVATFHYLNPEYDIAILRCDDGKGILMPLPYPIEFKGVGIQELPMGYGTYGGIRAGDVVCTVVHDRDAEGGLSMSVHLEYGIVNAPEPTGENNRSIAWFNPWDITLGLTVRPGDSGSPLFAFDNGKPVIVAVVRAASLTEPTGYAVLLPMVDRYLELP